MRAISTRSRRTSREHHHRLHPARRADGGRGGEPADGAGRRAGHRQRAQGRARFVRFCDCFEIPILTLRRCARVPAGDGQEYNGVIKHGAKLLVCLWRGDGAEGHGHHAQGLWRGLRGDVVEASARRFQLCLADLGDRGDGGQGGTEILHRADLGDPEKIAAHTKEYEDRFANPFVAAERGFIDEVIQPRSDPETGEPGLCGLRQQGEEDAVEEARQYSAVRGNFRILPRPTISGLMRGFRLR
jgi:hypothetical protein